MKIALGADHKGFRFKGEIKKILLRLGHSVLDFGTDSEDSVDFPDYGLQVAHAVADHKSDFGITVCWTGNGMNITANKVKGVRSGMALNTEMAYYTRLHNDANVLSLAGKYTPEEELEEIVKTFIETKFEGGRHTARVEKIMKAEAGKEKA
ncbi:MAG: ribose 5-phosphate isomerase B [candidate division Zixibacteria bacterium]|nr:ribose 5-phosphate isomerase B [candidate division Zixibacteria bacterium]